MENKQFKTLKELKEIIKFPLYLKRYIDKGGITRYQLINLERKNYWVKDFNIKEEVLNYFNSK